jgi:hypothetical protein
VADHADRHGWRLWGLAALGSWNAAHTDARTPAGDGARSRHRVVVILRS